MSQTHSLRELFRKSLAVDEAEGDTIEVALDASGQVHVEAYRWPKGYVRNVQLTVEFKK